MINKINSFPTDDGTYMLALPRQGELTDLSGRLTKIIIFASLLQWGIDRFAKQTRSASPRQGELTDSRSERGRRRRDRVVEVMVRVWVRT